MGSYCLNPQITLISTDKNNKILICVNLRNLWLNKVLKKQKQVAQSYAEESLRAAESKP